jgi:hypothetical protein
VKSFTSEYCCPSYVLVQTLPREVSVATLPKQANPERIDWDWLGIVKILVVQAILLFAASGAVIQYLNWSSGVAQAEFANKLMMAGRAVVTKPRVSCGPILHP